MKQAIKEILTRRVFEKGYENGMRNKMLGAMMTLINLENSILGYLSDGDSIDLEIRRQLRISLIDRMKQTQAMFWELQVILGVDDLEKQAEDHIEWQELQSIPH